MAENDQDVREGWLFYRNEEEEGISFGHLENNLSFCWIRTYFMEQQTSESKSSFKGYKSHPCVGDF